MAKIKAPELSPEVVAVNTAGEARREKEKSARAKNNEKQKRFRESMKAGGYKQVLLWAFPCPADVREKMAVAGFRQVTAWEKPDNVSPRMKPDSVVKIAVEIKEPMIGASDKIPEVREALSSALGSFINALEKSKLTKADRAAYSVAFQNLIRPLGDPFG